MFQIKKRKVQKHEDETCIPEFSDAVVSEDGSLILNRKLSGWDDYPWTCCECLQSMNNAETLKQHISTVHGNTVRYACTDCPKEYTKYTMFISHVRQHRPILKCCCDTCGKWYPNSKATEKHRSTHGDERIHDCLTCGKRFRMQSALLVHARSHLPAEVKNQYQCDQCPKRFATKPNLMAHKRIHAGKEFINLCLTVYIFLNFDKKSCITQYIHCVIYDDNSKITITNMFM